MAYPVLYDVTYSYTGFQAAQGDNSFPGTQLDADLAGLQTSIDDLATFVEGFSRSDGKLGNGSVDNDQLADSIKLLIGDPTTLAAVYAARDAAAVSATSAAGSATAASGSAGAAATSATASANSATASAGSATTAGNAATAAATSATNASNSATAAAASATVVAGNQFAFDTSTTMADPGGPGGLRLNNATVASATAIAFDNASAASGNPDISAFIAQWGSSSNSVKGQIQIRKIGSPAVYAIFNITGTVTNSTTWLQVPVAYVSGNGSFSAADALSVQFTRTGDAGSMTGPGVSVDSEIALFNGASGTAVKRATGSGLAKLTSGVLSIAAAGTDYLAPAAIGVTVQAFDAQLFSNIPQNIQSGTYAIVATDAQKQIFHSAVGAHTYTIPANASVAFPIGTTITFVNDAGSGNVTIAITTDTLIQAGSGSTGSRTLAASSMATAVKIGSTKWMISGSGLT